MNLLTLPEIQIIEETETELEPLFQVIIHNDDVTPMDFVVNVLTSIFLLLEPDAMEVMLTAHFKGAAYVQTLPKAEDGHEKPGELNWLHAIALDSKGNLYLGDIIGMRIQKFVLTQ